MQANGAATALIGEQTDSVINVRHPQVDANAKRRQAVPATRTIKGASALKRVIATVIAPSDVMAERVAHWAKLFVRTSHWCPVNL
jgi:DNA-binding transcriptional regulator YdaS (Cro superfamily)